MSERDDVFDVDDLGSVLSRVARGVRDRPVALGVALAVVAVALSLGLVPHVFGAVGGDAVDTGSGANPAPEADGEARQRYQNYLTNLAFVFAPIFLPLVAVGVAFAGALYAPGSRTDRTVQAVVGGAVGVALGYALFVGVAHLAFGEAPEGYIVETFPVSVRFGALAVNALALGVAAGVGAALAGGAATVVAPEGGGVPGPDAGVDADAGDDDGETATEPTAGDGERDVIDAGSSSTDAASDGGGERPARLDASGPASDYRDGEARHGTRTPTYDPDGRNWDGSGEDAP
jgi:hypothetical protein